MTYFPRARPVRLLLMMLLAMSTSSILAAPLGRLFYTAQERALLEGRGGEQVADGVKLDGVAVTPARTVYWVSGRPYLSPPGAATGLRAGQVRRPDGRIVETWQAAASAPRP